MERPEVHHTPRYIEASIKTELLQSSAPALPLPFRIADSINAFGFSVVGMYGDDFLSAGKKATAVFQAREWLGAVSDQLIPNILLMATIAISLSSGSFALVVEEFDGYSFTNFRKPITTAFL